MPHTVSAVVPASSKENAMASSVVRARTALGLAVLAAACLGLASPARAQTDDAADDMGIRAMGAAAGAAVRAAKSQVTGLVTFMSAAPGTPVKIGANANDPADARAAAFLSAHGRAFGLAGASSARVERVTRPDALGMERVRYRQTHAGVPITAGELSVHLTGASVVAVTAKTLAVDDTMNMTPSFSADEAASQARTYVDKHFPGQATGYTTPRLEVFNRGLLDGTRSPTRLAWFIEARGRDLWQYIWIDAHTGMRLLAFSQLAHAMSRRIHDANNTSTTPGTLVRSEGQAPVGNAELDSAYDYVGDTYAYFLGQHGRDSFDNLGGAMVATVRFCGAPPCPETNALWNGTQTAFGQGYAVDDVVAHEFTHAVTQHSANLFYYMQAGALNESYSDIFGETIDLLNERGNDSAGVRWLLGEDTPQGALRNMREPTQFGHPGKVSDPQFFCTTQPGSLFGDSGGVHRNSGVPNHAYTLMVDGGSYNGFAISGIGLTKAAQVQYRALTAYLLSASTFADNANALKQACADLIPSVVTGAECVEVAKAIDAVEMASNLPCPAAPPPSVALCAVGQVPNTVFFDNLENPASGNWTVDNLLPPETTVHWVYPVPPPLLELGLHASSGVHNFWGYDAPQTGDSAIGMTNGVGLPPGARLQFRHSYGFENAGATNFDGGVLEYSADGGPWTDAGSLIVAGAAYGGVITPPTIESHNPLAGRAAFVRESYGYTATQLDLASLAGKSVRFRFRIGTDESVDDFGWYVDDIRIYTCANAVPLASAILPVSRSVPVNSTATVFAAIINGGATTAHGVSIALDTPVPATLTYQTTDASNQLTGTANTPVDIPPGEVRTFVIGVKPTQPFGPTNIRFTMSGTDASPASITTGVNTLLLSSTTTLGPDVIALAATHPNPGLIVDLPAGSPVAAFSVAAANVGAAGQIRVSASAGSMPVTVTVCQTGATGACGNPPASTVTTSMGASSTGTFSFFVSGTGFVPFDPGKNRVFAIFTDMATGNIIGETSTAVRTQ
jgi:Zn-dependent metalloprotease